MHRSAGLFTETIIYEMHVRGFTAHPNSGIAPSKRGTYAGPIEKSHTCKISASARSNSFRFLPSTSRTFGAASTIIGDINRCRFSLHIKDTVLDETRACNRSTSRATPSPSRATDGLTARPQMHVEPILRDVDPDNMLHVPSPACAGAGSCTRGGEGLPSATAAPTLRPRRDEAEIQGRRAAAVSKVAHPTNPSIASQASVPPTTEFHDLE